MCRGCLFFPGELLNGEAVHRWAFGALCHQCDLSSQALQQSAVQEEWQMHPQEQRLLRLPPFVTQGFQNPCPSLREGPQVPGDWQTQPGEH